MTAEYRGSWGTLRIETEMIDVTSAGPRPDKSWRYTDAQGHQHRWDDGWPTLEWFVTERYWCEDCEDGHTEGEWICLLCEEVIQPGMLGPSMHREYVPGLISAYLNDEPISGDEAQRLIAQAAAADA